MKLMGLYLFCFILFIITVNLGDASRLSQRNRAILKSIKSEDGDVIDCVDIYHQPAFDHPLLKDHIIKMKPSYHQERMLAQNKLSEVESNGNKKQITQIWQLSGECPEGTVPIRRTENGPITKEKKHINIRQPSSIPHEYAVAHIPAGTGTYYGASAVLDLWQPFVERTNEFSLAQLWLAAGFGSSHNTIEVGWMVGPTVYSDRLARLFVFWTSDDYQSTGCYDLRCPGFVQTSSQIAVGGAINISGTNSEVSLGVWKDTSQQRWWLHYNGIQVGYWPTSIFTTLNGSASVVDWGGEILNANISGPHTRTEMGSGSFPQAGPGQAAAYFRNLSVFDNSNTSIPFPKVQRIVTNENCYNITLGNNSNWGNYFYYGGPGRNPNCP